MKKIYFIIGVIILSIVCLSLTNNSFASYYEFNGYGYDEKAKMTYEILNDGTACLESWDEQYATNLTIPSYVNGRKVTQIGPFFASSRDNLKTITIPNTVTTIGYCSFWNNLVLEKVNLPSSVKIIGEDAFADNELLKTINLSNVKIIDAWAFSNCSSLTNIDIQTDNLESIGEYAFYGCTSLKEVKLLSDNLTAIGNSAFSGCENLEKLYLSNSIKSIGKFNLLNKNKLTVYGIKGSKAQTFANENKLNFVAIIFEDVFKEDWFYDAVNYTYNNGMIKGMDSTHFGPYKKLSRAMLVTILWRMEGSPKTNLNNFPDVKSSDWYYTAVNWAASKGIINGYSSGKFGPNDNVTREQLCSILMNYARYKGKDVTKRANTSKFVDFKNTASYFQNAVSWCVANEIVSGKSNGTKIDPKGTATRAEAAAMLRTYCLNIK